MYITEQFCSGQTYFTPKYRLLTNHALASVSKTLRESRRYMSQTIDPDVKAGKQLELIIRQINEGTLPTQ